MGRYFGDANGILRKILELPAQSGSKWINLKCVYRIIRTHIFLEVLPERLPPEKYVDNSAQLLTKLGLFKSSKAKFGN